jgi:hypothetical protein
MRADGQTDMTKLVVGFCNFANVPKIITVVIMITYSLINLLTP